MSANKYFERIEEQIMQILQEPITVRKNLSKINELLALEKKDGIIIVLGIIDTNELIKRHPEIKEWFNRSKTKGDDRGVARSLGDLIGGSGLLLREKLDNRGNRIRCQYIMPQELPLVIDDSMYKMAIYPNI